MLHFDWLITFENPSMNGYESVNFTDFRVKTSVYKPEKYNAYCLRHFGVGVIVEAFSGSHTGSNPGCENFFLNVFLSRMFQKSLFRFLNFKKRKYFGNFEAP